MEMVIHEDKSETSVAYENDATVKNIASRSCSEEKRKVPAAAAGVKLYRLVAVSFGLLCILQATLNISLRLVLYSGNSIPCSETIYREKSELERKMNTFGWMHFSGSFYYISSIKKTWQESRNDCLQRGADLIIINSKEEQNFTRQFEKYLWIGLTDLEAEGTWRWVDGTLLTKSFWSSGEPNGYTFENCAHTKHYNLEINWNDEVCSNSHFWMCEEKVSP